MTNIFLAVVVLALLVGLLVGERRKRPKLILTFKTPLSALFVASALAQPHPVPSYYHWVLAGLLFGLIGDVCLAIPGNKTFRAGLVAFLVGHILYVVAFVGLTEPLGWLTPGHLLVAAVSIGVFRWLQPHLGAMLVPVALYVIIITVMLAAAWVAFLNPALNALGAWTLFLGALFFYISDVLVARDRFVRGQFMNRLVGLPLYYGGQFLLAFSIGLVQ
jgi:uncharacterized membrane protein YhhN